MTLRRGILAAAAALFVTIGGLGAGRSLAGASWTITLTPGATTVFLSTVYAITVTDHSLPNDLGCVDVQLPASFVIGAVSNPVTTSGRSWTWAKTGNTIVIHAVSGGDRIRNGESVVFTIQAQATQPGTWTWANHGHRQQDCTGAELAGSPLTVIVAPVVIVTPNPTPVATPKPTPVPTPTREPASPSPTPTATPMPSDAESLRPSSTPRPAGGPVSTASPAPIGSRMAPLDEDATGEVSLALDTFALMDGEVMWIVPGAAVGVPGLLVLIWVGLQAVGALAWVPMVRRLGWGAATTRRRRRSAKSA